MREGNPIQADTLRGAGYYGATEPTHKTKCVNSNNPAGHNPDCPCKQPSPMEAWEQELLELFGEA